MKGIKLEWNVLTAIDIVVFFLHSNMAAGIHACLSVATLGSRQ